MEIFNKEQEQVISGLGILADSLRVSGIAAFADVQVEHLQRSTVIPHPFIDDADAVFVGTIADPTTAGAFLYIATPDKVEDLIIYKHGDLLYPSYHVRIPGYDEDTIERYITGPYLDDSDDEIEIMAISMVERVFAMLSSLLGVPIRVEPIDYEQHVRARNARVKNAR